MLRSMFQEQLEHVKANINALGVDVVAQLESAIQAFQEASVDRIDTLVASDVHINERELEINEQVFDVIARQQPVAGDLRKLIVAMKIAGDLERVADIAVDMAKVVRRIPAEEAEGAREELTSLANDATAMVSKALLAYEKKDVLAAQKIARMDDEIDERFGRFIKQLFRQDVGEQDVETITQLAFIARYIERVADYATNLSEWIIYEANGQHLDLN